MSAEASSSLGLDTGYIRSLDSIMKIVEAVLGLCTFICAADWGTSDGGGWIQFVGMFSFIVILILYIFHLFRIIYKLPPTMRMPIELIVCGVFFLSFLTAGVVAARFVDWDIPSMQAACFFSFASMVAFTIDALNKFASWRQGAWRRHSDLQRHDPNDYDVGHG